MSKIDKSQCLEVLGQEIRCHRKSKGLLQREVADKVGITQAHYSMIESGKRDAEFVTIVKICKTLGIDLNNVINSLK